MLIDELPVRYYMKYCLQRLTLGNPTIDLMTKILIRLLFGIACINLWPTMAATQDQAFSTTKRTVIANDGVNLVCELRGRGDIALVFLHGWCGDHEYWKNQANVFASE